MVTAIIPPLKSLLWTSVDLWGLKWCSEIIPLWSLNNLKCCPHSPRHTHNLVGGTYLLSHRRTHTHTHSDCRWDERRWSSQLPVGGPALHVSHSGISVALRQSQIVLSRPSPRRSLVTASNTGSGEQPEAAVTTLMECLLFPSERLVWAPALKKHTKINVLRLFFFFLQQITTTMVIIMMELWAQSCRNSRQSLCGSGEKQEWDRNYWMNEKKLCEGLLNFFVVFVYICLQMEEVTHDCLSGSTFSGKDSDN